MFLSSTKREIRHFHVVVVQEMAKKCTKEHDARAKLLFCQSKPIGFLAFLLPSPSSLLKLPNTGFNENVLVTERSYLSNVRSFIISGNTE